MDLQSEAMLVKLHIANWTGSITDKDATKELNTNKHAAVDAARVHKRLFPKEALRGISKTVSLARTTNYDHTLPWPDKGWRMLTVPAYDEYTRLMNEFREQLLTQRRKFLLNYDEYIVRARRELGSLFSDNDYPSIDQVKTRFDLSYRIQTIPDEQHFIADLAKSETEKIRRVMREQLQTDIDSAIKDLYNRLDETLSAISDRLGHDAGGKAMIFRDTLITNVRDLVEIIPRLNIFGDANLAKLCDDVRSRIANVDPDALRPNSARFDPKERNRVRTEAEIMKQALQGCYPAALEAAA